jgi:hypothetical protein
LKDPRWKNVIIAGLAFGVAMVLKFSLILLVPFFAIITIVYACLKNQGIKSVIQYCLLSIAAALIGLVFVIGPIYQLNMAGYPYEKQLSDTKITLNDMPKLPAVLKNIDIFMAGQPVLRPWAHYLLGLEMATNRTGTGNSTFFLGEMSANARINYFPTLYLLKVPIAFHILTLIVLGWLAFLAIKNNVFKNTCSRLKKWTMDHFDIFAMIVFLGIYWATSLAGNLNIGLRHILPTFAFTYILVVFGLTEIIKNIQNERTKKTAISIVAILLGWFIFSSLSIFPHYLAYYNELAGGSGNGYKIAVDSNLDWGQDLKRLNIWINNYNSCAAESNCFIEPGHVYPGKPIDKIYVDYFGAGDPNYYLGEKYVPWQPSGLEKDFPKGNYLAVSVNEMQGQRAKALPDYKGRTDEYQWLDQYEPPVAKIGYSIFVYYIK